MAERKATRSSRSEGAKSRSSYGKGDSSSKKRAPKSDSRSRDAKPWTLSRDGDSGESSYERRRNDKPARNGGKKSYDRESYGGDKPKRNYGDRDDRPKRSYGDRDGKPTRRFDDRDDKPKRSYGDRDDRPKRSYGDRDGKPARRFDDRDDKPRRSYGDRDDRPKRSYGDRDGRPARRFDDRDDKPRRSYGDRDDRPKRSYGDRDGKPARRFDDRDDKPRRSYGDRDSKPKRTFSDGGYDKPKRRFDDKEKGSDYRERDSKRSYITSYEPEDSRVRKARKQGQKQGSNSPKISVEVRLNKFIANSGVCSRREADTFIKAGLVTVNGEIVTELGVKVLPSDEIRFNGELLKGEQKVYMVMNKPKGYVTTVEDPHADKTVMEIVDSYTDYRVYPVGRLDKNSTGVLMFTNDGELTLQLTHPSYNKKKIYEVNIDNPLTKNDMQRLVDGVELEDGLSFFDSVEYLNEEKTQFGVEIHSGKNRIIRRMFEYLGYKVTKLDRVYFAGLTKKNLKRGECRFLTDKEVSILKMGSYE